MLIRWTEFDKMTGGHQVDSSGISSLCVGVHRLCLGLFGKVDREFNSIIAKRLNFMFCH